METIPDLRRGPFRDSLRRHAICQWNEINPSGLYVPMVVGVADRMLTASDIQYEPPQKKIRALSKTAVVMIAGNAAVHSRVATAVWPQLGVTTSNTPTILDAAEAYAQGLSEYRKREAEQLILKPLGLTFDDFNAHQNDLAPQTVDQINGALRRFRIEAEAIVAGVDGLGPHIYVIRDTGTVDCHDFVGFAAIGIGASHAASQFMSAKYSRDWDFPRTLFLAFSGQEESGGCAGRWSRHRYVPR